MDVREALNEQQRKVVTTTQGPVLVLAGAGSGKTRSVIYRTAYLISEQHVNPQNILIVTFTNKAASELKERLRKTFNLSVYSLWVGTFHAICVRILRRESDLLEFSSNFSIYDVVDQKSLLKKIYKKLDVNSKKFALDRVRNIISRHKNSLILPKDFFLFNEENYFTKEVYRIYSEYQKQLKENNALDFDDLLMHTALLFHNNKQIKAKYATKFQYIMIDEYQDTNYAQFKLINLLAEDHQNLCVVGDDDQAIYSWRGATIKNILNFESDYKNVKTIRLEKNYRSPDTILKVANCLIKNNSARHPKELWTELRSKNLPKLVRLQNEQEEADYVLKNIAELHRKKGINLNDIVILYRTNAQSRVLESRFLKYDFKYQIIGGVNFYQRKEIKDILAYLKLFVNPGDNESFLRIINFPRRGIGKKTQQRIIDFADRNEYSLLNSLQYDSLYDYLGSYAERVKDFFRQLQHWQTESGKTGIVDFLENLITDLGLEELYDTDDPQDVSRWENIREFMGATREFAENYRELNNHEPLLSHYIQNLSLQTDIDNYDENEASVKLMTMHNAKGLEFSYVFIVGVEDGLIPHSRSIDAENQLEEERRLLYVAITRAKKNVTMTYVQTRRIFNTFTAAMPSRFLMEIEEDLLEKESGQFYENQAPRTRSKRKRVVVTENKKHFRIGQKIKHAKFGKGVILNVDGTGIEAKLTISFSGGKLKKIVGSFVEKL